MEDRKEGVVGSWIETRRGKKGVGGCSLSIETHSRERVWVGWGRGVVHSLRDQRGGGWGEDGDKRRESTQITGG